MRQLIPLAIMSAAAGAAALLAFSQRLPLSGMLHHDFGELQIEGEEVFFEHSYTLVNQSGSPIRILNVKPGCSCTTTDPGPFDVPAGESIDIDVTLRLTHAGRKDSVTLLQLDGDHEPMELTLDAIGVREIGMWPQTPFTALVSEGSVPMIVLAETLDGSEPPVPEIRAPEGVVATWGEWTKRSDADPADYVPAKWRGRVLLEPAPMPLQSPAPMAVILQGAPPAVVTIEPYRPSPAGPAG